MKDLQGNLMIRQGGGISGKQIRKNASLPVSETDIDI